MRWYKRWYNDGWQDVDEDHIRDTHCVDPTDGREHQIKQVRNRVKIGVVELSPPANAHEDISSELALFRFRCPTCTASPRRGWWRAGRPHSPPQYPPFSFLCCAAYPLSCNPQSGQYSEGYVVTAQVRSPTLVGYAKCSNWGIWSHYFLFKGHPKQRNSLKSSQPFFARPDTFPGFEFFLRFTYENRIHMQSQPWLNAGQLSKHLICNCDIWLSNYFEFLNNIFF